MLNGDRHPAAHESRPRAARAPKRSTRCARCGARLLRTSNTTSPAGERGSRYDRVSGAVARGDRRRGRAGREQLCRRGAADPRHVRATGREVVVARNQLIEIGGGFRLPDVLARSGATLVEVGATNKVYLADFERALSPQHGAAAARHPSNYPHRGLRRRRRAARPRRARHGVPACWSSKISAAARSSTCARYGLPHERTVREAVADGIDLVAFSGDKLLGGPQAGIIVGSARRDRAAAREPAAARAARRQDDARRARRDAAPAPRARRRARASRSTACSAATSTELLERGATLRAAARRPVARRCVDDRRLRRRRDAAAQRDSLVRRGADARARRSRTRSRGASARAARRRWSRGSRATRVLIDLRTIPPERDADVVGAVARALAA